MAFRSEKQRAAFEALRPKTYFLDLTYHPEMAMVGGLMQHLKLGIEMEYRESFWNPEDGRLYHCGVVVRTRRGCGIAIGCEWACAAERLVIR